MGDGKEGKRKKDEYDNRKEKQTKRARTRSRSPEAREKGSSRSRRRHHSRSRSAERPSKRDRQNQVKETPQESEVKKEMPERKNREDMLNTRTGGAYIPPARLRMLQAQITDKSSIAYQRLAWEALKKSIHGHINKINVGNIGIIIKELLKENIVRGRGLLCRSVIQAQAASPTFTNVYAALVSAVNSRFPNIGELLLKRLVIQFKRGFKRNDKPTCISSASFVAHLVNQRVAHEILALELLTLLVETPTDDSVEVAIAFLKECGQKLTEVSSKGVNAIFEMLRNILHEGQLDKRVQYMIEVMFQVWKDGFKDHPALIDDLELVPEEEQFTHLLMLDDATDPQDILNVFKFDDKYEENEQKYKTLSKEILGSDAEDSNEEGSGESGSDESEEEEEETEEKTTQGVIIDNTETNLVALRRTIYLTINSSLDFEECAHKLMKMQLKPGQEVELCHMFLDCCAEQRTYEKFYGLLAQRFCNINRIYIDPFQQIFKDSYSTAHRLDTNRLRNVSKFFAHLLFTDSIGWDVLECVKLNEEDTTSSSRIYIKILFQELAEYMGLKKLNDRLKDPTLQDAFQGVFPRDNPKNTRFSINFFTSIGLGGLTDELREHLKQMPKNVPAQITEIKLDSSSSESSSDSSSSSSEDSSSDSSSSDGEDEGDKKKENNKEKKSKKKDAEAPKPPEEVNPPKAVERWGHEGFFETYGKDARRTEPRPDRRERDNDNFLKPRDDRDTRKKDFNQRNDNVGKDDRRDGPYRREEDSRRNRDDDRRRDREDYSRYRREDDSNSRREELLLSRGNRDDNRKRDNGNRSRDFDDYRNKNHDDERRGDRDTRSRREDDSSSRKEEESRRNKDDSGIRDKDNRSRDFDDYRNKNHDDERRRDRDTRSRREDDSSFRKEEESRRNKDDSKIRDKDNRSRDFDDYRSKHHEDQRKRERGDNSKSRREEEHGENRDDNRRRDKDNRILDDNNKKNKKEEKKRKNESSDEESRTPEKEKHLRSKNKKSKHKQESDESSSESSSSESSSDSSSTRKKTKRSNKENSKYGKSTTPDDGWDIRRAESVRKEVVGRYWDN